METVLKPSAAKVTGSATNRFRTARIRLTAVYAVLLAVILFVSSFITYTVFSQRLGSGQVWERIQRNEPGERESTPQEESKELLSVLVFSNGLLLLAAAGLSYWLAGITLEPIRKAYLRQQRFLSDASHELRTPLTILRTDIENAMAAQAPKKGAVDLAGSIEEVDRMADLVSNLLILSRAEEFRKPESSETKVDLQQTASLVVNRMRAYADTYHVAIRLQSGDTVWVSGNAELLFKAVRNLVKNGVDYNRTGGTVTVTVWAADAWAVVTVADTGIGMSQDELDRVFDRFYRADASRSRQTGGSGLGLSIVKSIVEQTGGSIDLESRPEHGTVATVRLPRYQH